MKNLKLLFGATTALLLPACNPSDPGSSANTGAGTGVSANAPANAPAPGLTKPEPVAVTVDEQLQGEAASALAFAANKRLARTVNLTGLEAPNEGDWGPKLEESYFEQIKQAGFTAIRLPVKFSNHALGVAPFTLEPGFMERIDWAVKNATSRGLAIIVDMHHYDELIAQPEANKARFLGLWGQIAARYKSQPASVLFELHNEPNDKLEPFWNQYAGEALAIVRKSNPKRTVIIGPNGWNSADRLSDLKLPNDENLIVTFHNYTPFEFTHQGATWISPVLPVGIGWPGVGVDFRPPWQNWSWDSVITPSSAGIEVTHNKPGGVFYLHRNNPASNDSSLRLKTDRAVTLSVSCFNNEGATQNSAKNFPLQTQAGVLQVVPLSACGDGTAFKDLFIENKGDSPQTKVVFQTLELSGPGGNDSVLTDSQGQVRTYLELAANWGKANKRPLFMGEFGSFELGEMASRVRWTKFTRSEAEKLGISWGYWDFNGSFGVFDPVKKVWRTELRDALLK